MAYVSLKEGTQGGSVVRSPNCQDIETGPYCFKVSLNSYLGLFALCQFFFGYFSQPL